MTELTEKQEAVLTALSELAQPSGERTEALYPTVRELADYMETSEAFSERVSDDEARGLLERLQESGHVAQFQDPEGDNQRYRRIGWAEPEQS